MRLRADFWVSAYIRRCEGEGVSAYLRRRGAAEAGAVIVKVDRLDGQAALFGLAASLSTERGIDRQFMRLHGDEWLAVSAVEERLQREVRIDPDVWMVEIEDRQGRSFLDMI